MYPGWAWQHRNSSTSLWKQCSSTKIIATTKLRQCERQKKVRRKTKNVQRVHFGGFLIFFKKKFSNPIPQLQMCKYSLGATSTRTRTKTDITRLWSPHMTLPVNPGHGSNAWMTSWTQKNSSHCCWGPPARWTSPIPAVAAAGQGRSHATSTSWKISTECRGRIPVDKRKKNHKWP